MAPLFFLLLLAAFSSPLLALPAERGRHLQQLAPAPSAPGNESLIFAQSRTARKDPLNHFDIYRSGWDLRNEHYWASVGYTAWPGFILAGLWFFVGVGYILLLCLCGCFCPQKLHGRHQGGNLLPLLFLILLTIAVIAGCVVVYAGQDRAHRELSDVLTYLVNESNIVVEKLSNVSTSLTEASNLMIVKFALPQSQQDQITALNSEIHTAAVNLQNQTALNAERISDAINKVRLSMVVIVGVMMFLVLLGFLFSGFGVLPLMYLLVMLGWLIIIGTWILCGIYIMLNNAVGDTCVSMREWVDHPSAATNLDDILPCVDGATANQTFIETQDTMNDTVANINNAVTNFINAGSSDGLPTICNPVYPELSSASCVDVNNVSHVWAPFVCNNTSNSSCPLQGRLDQGLYSQLVTATKVVSTLNTDASFLVNLKNCVFVRDVFVQIQVNHCQPLRMYLKWQYVGLALISGGLMFAIMLWIVFSRRRKHRFFHHKSARNNDNVPVDNKDSVI